MTDSVLSEHNEKFHQLHHDIQNCLNVISMGTDILADSRDDDATFAEFYDVVREERRAAVILVDEFLKTACDACSSG